VGSVSLSLRGICPDGQQPPQRPTERHHHSNAGWRPAQCGTVHLSPALQPYCSPNPCAFCIAVSSLLRSLACVAYSGSSSALKQVCAVGSLSLSGPARCKTNGGGRGAAHVSKQHQQQSCESPYQICQDQHAAGKGGGGREAAPGNSSSNTARRQWCCTASRCVLWAACHCLRQSGQHAARQTGREGIHRAATTRTKPDHLTVRRIVSRHARALSHARPVPSTGCFWAKSGDCFLGTRETLFGPAMLTV
jgi:hypothetical protein